VAVDAWNNPQVAYLAFGNLKYATCVPVPDGDIDGNGAATVRDLMVLQRAAAGQMINGVPPCTYPLAGDFDGSGGPSATDLMGMTALLAENN